MRNTKILSLQSLRGLAAISIAFFHLNTGGYISNFFETAWIAVDFFFVLSGFVISLSYSEKISSVKTFYIYQKKRFIRLYPLHFAMLIIFLIVEFLKLLVEINFGLVANNKAFSTNNLSAFLANLFFIHNLIIYQPTFNYPSWSVSAEFLTYAIFGFVTLITRNSRILFYSFSIILILIFNYLLFFLGFESDNITGPLRCLYSFFIGVLTQKIHNYLSNKKAKLLSIPSTLMILISILLINYLGNDNSGIIVFIPYIFAITILALVLTDEKAIIIKILSYKFLVYLGTISYSIYLTHAFIWWVGNMIFRFIFNFPTEINSSGKTIVLINNIFLADIISLIGIIFVLFISHISYSFFERKFY